MKILKKVIEVDISDMGPETRKTIFNFLKANVPNTKWRIRPMLFKDWWDEDMPVNIAGELVPTDPKLVKRISP